ncbi:MULTISPECIES: hypothetical protein [Brevibacillus]|uniref:hypothetical protein n=1 Tax=Brevibacillus TaxID=55080 RepID=UPI0002A4D34F|nr:MULTISPECIES: hypothetical protein [Brevibacillus]ELK42139.1 hypothetical protein D478_10265 [Brevibacillus agri BAB-2500]MDR9507354.1 hypothetical protein [Brevibacillus agri]MED1826168.1 hypothetical protein [Brevibacillus agri]QHZ55495.1 hypothetical protein M655_007455 [Brevibacillus sp. NSP2.1]
MKKVMVTLAVTMCAASLFYGYTNIYAKDSLKIEQEYEIYAKNEVQKKLSETYDDAIKTFKINQSDYTYYSLHETDYGLGKDESTTLFMIIFNDVLKKQKQGDFEPGLFLKKDLSEAIVLYKSLDSGTNHLYVYKRDKDQWTLVKEDNQKGKKAEKVQYKSLKEFEADTTSK